MGDVFKLVAMVVGGVVLAGFALKLIGGILGFLIPILVIVGVIGGVAYILRGGVSRRELNRY